MPSRIRRDRAADRLGPGGAKGISNLPAPFRDRVNTEIVVRYRTDAWRVVYVAEIKGSLWVVHAFQKKSKSGIKTPKSDIDLVKTRLVQLRRELSP